MQIQDELAENSILGRITALTEKLRDISFPITDTSLYHLLHPQGWAEFCGLKKLIEKEYTQCETLPGIPSLGID